MINVSYRNSVCEIVSGDDSGTGFLVSSELVLTALHCVDPSEDAETTLRFCDGPSMKATIIYQNEEKDICLLRTSKPLELKYIKVLDVNLAENVDWQTFGYPVSKGSIGHKAAGTVSRMLPCLENKIDIDLHVSSEKALEDYKGLSGAPLMIEGYCVGIILFRMDKAIGALSIKCIAEEIAEYEIEIYKEEEDSSLDLGYLPREGFQDTFEKLISGGEYHFLEGVHGIGKTTFCKNYTPLSEHIHRFGAYALLDEEELSSPDYRVRTNSFMDWACSTQSILINGKPFKYNVSNESSLSEDFNEILNAYNDYCAKQNKVGILFIDGLNEVHSNERLSELLSIFPRKLPSKISIIFTATNFANLNTNFPCARNDNNTHKLPTLSDYQCELYCRQKLNEKSNLNQLVTSIVEKVCGHPLYLRYLVEEVSSSEEEEFNFESIPAFKGNIEDYYENIWSEFNQDQEAINLLGTICRLRESLSKVDFNQFLTSSQKTSSIATFVKIQHLLENDNIVWVYHNSFSQFIAEKTKDINIEIHSQIATACLAVNSVNYAVRNIIFHYLKGKEELQIKAVELCCQQWVDRAEQSGVEPDQLNFDIESTIAISSQLGLANETVRLLLLSQRIKFRNNSLFFKNAFLVAKALISIGRYQEALHYTIRYKTIVISYQEALELAYMLMLKEEFSYAYDLLDKIKIELSRSLQRDSYPASEFIQIFQLIAWASTYLQEFTEGNFQDEFNKLCRIMESGIKSAFDDVSQEEIPNLLGEITHIPMAFSLFYYERYGGIDAIMEMFKVKKSQDDYDDILKEAIKNILYGSVKAIEKMEMGHLKKVKKVFVTVYEDIEKYPITPSSVEEFDIKTLLSAMIEYGASVALVESIYRDFEKETFDVLTKANGVDLNYVKLENFFKNKQIDSFRNNNLSEIVHIKKIDCEDWQQSLIQIIQNISVLDGSIRKIHLEEDTNTEQITQLLQDLDNLLDCLVNLRLSERVNWQSSYSIPESIIPWLIQKCFRLYCEFFPEETLRVLNIFTNVADHQFGIYCEGGREVVKDIVLTLFGIDLSQEVVIGTVQFIDKCRTYALERIENRHDLTPFLLEICHWYANFGAIEKAEETYAVVLAHSMGPNWYKEDQFSILLECFKNLDTSSSRQHLPSLERLLNTTDGEITFRRYVRYDKENLFGYLIDKGMTEEAFAYFKRQTCGGIHELTEELERDKTDRISKYVGNRYPGNLIDERGTILQMNTSLALDWRLHFALLKIYAAGDHRHLSKIAITYAKLLNKHISPENHPEMCKKVLLHDQSGISLKQRTEFRRSFYSELGDHAKLIAKNYFHNWDKKETNQPNVPQVKTVTNSEDTVRSPDDFFMAGMFGTSDSNKKSGEKINEAENQAKLGNKVVAKDMAIDSLLSRQAGGWSIWHSRDSLSKQWDFINDGCNDGIELIQSIEPLISSEQYAWEWKVAESVISLLSSKQDNYESLQLMEYVTEHIYTIIAKKPTVAQAVDNSKINQSSIDDDTFEFIVWLADHPKRVRRELAAEALADILNRDSKYWQSASIIAFSNQKGYAPDVLCGILKYLAEKDSHALWAEIGSSLETIDLDAFTHTSRYSILLQILELLNVQESVEDLKSRLEEKFIGEDGNFNELTTHTPAYLTPISDDVNSLIKAGVCGKEIFTSIIECLVELYKPLPLEDVEEIENLVLQSFREQNNGRLDRFNTTLRWALNICLFRYITQENHTLIESSLRLHNPNLPSLENTIIEPDGITYFEGLCERNIQKLTRSLFSNGKLVISHKEMITYQDEPQLIEVTALILNREMNSMPQAPPLTAEFSSIEYPKIKFNPPRVYETCSSVVPMRVPLGSFTPAVPLPEFLELTNSQVDDYDSEYWTKGASQDINSIGMLDSEGSRLTIPKDKLTIPPPKKLVWAISLHRRLIVIVDEKQNIIYNL